MIRKNLIEFVSSKLSIDKKYINDDTKIDLLCILSDYMNSLDDEQKNDLIISKEGLKSESSLFIQQENEKVFIEINFLFKNKGNESVKLYEEIGRDGFLNHHIERVILALDIEQEFEVQINDEDWEKMTNIGDIIKAIIINSSMN